MSDDYRIKEQLRNEDKSKYKVENKKGEVRVRTTIEQEVITYPSEIKKHLDELKKNIDRLDDDISEEGLNRRRTIVEQEIEKYEQTLEALKKEMQNIGSDEDIQMTKERRDKLIQEHEKVKAVYDRAIEEETLYDEHKNTQARVENLKVVLSDWEKFKDEGYTAKRTAKNIEELKPYLNKSTKYEDITIDGHLSKEQQATVEQIFKEAENEDRDKKIQEKK